MVRIGTLVSWRGVCACKPRPHRTYQAETKASLCLQCRTAHRVSLRIEPITVEQQPFAALESRAHRLELRCIDLHRQLTESQEAYARLAAIDTRRQSSIEASLRQELKMQKALIDLYENGLLDGQFLLEGRMDEIRAMLPISIRQTFREDDPNYPRAGAKKVTP